MPDTYKSYTEELILGKYMLDKIQYANEPEKLEAFEAAIKTISSPTPADILEDIEIGIRLVKQLKQDTAGLHPSVINIIRALF